LSHTDAPVFPGQEGASFLLKTVPADLVAGADSRPTIQLHGNENYQFQGMFCQMITGTERML